MRRTLIRCAASFVSLVGAASPGAAQSQPEAARYIKVVDADQGERVQLHVSSRSFKPVKGEGPEVHLVGVVHIGDRAYYDALQRFLDMQGVVLFEGVKPEAAGHEHAGNDAAKAKVTASRQRLLAVLIAQFRREHKDLPESIDELLTSLKGGAARIGRSALTDGWGHAQTYLMVRQQDTGTSRFDIISLGSDGAPGGEGGAADVRFSEQKPLTRAEVDAAGEGIQTQLAKAMGLEFQLAAINYDRPNWRNSDMSIDELQDRLEEKGASGMLFQMIDGTSLMSKMIGMVLGFVERSPEMSMMVKLMMVETIAHADVLMANQPDGMGKMMEVIVIDRNTTVLNDLRTLLNTEKGVQSVALFYGAGHLPDLEARLERDFGYTFASDTWFTAIDIDLASVPGAKVQARQMRGMVKQMIERQLKAGQK